MKLPLKLNDLKPGKLYRLVQYNTSSYITIIKDPKVANVYYNIPMFDDDCFLFLKHRLIPEGTSLKHYIKWIYNGVSYFSLVENKDLEFEEVV